MPKILISFNRAGSRHAASVIYVHLTQHFDQSEVILGCSEVPHGVDARAYVQERVREIDVVLAVVGPEWSQHMQGTWKQFTDLERIGLESALKSGKWVIPVLVEGAEILDSSQLPESLQAFPWQEAITVRPKPYIKEDCTLIAKRINQGMNAPVKRIVTAPLDGIAAPSVEDILPEPFEWLHIPAGKVELEGRRDSYILEGRTRTFSIKPFFIAKYPITNAQFRAFVDGGEEDMSLFEGMDMDIIRELQQFVGQGGYHSRDWWLDEGWEIKERLQWSQPRYWGKEGFDAPEHPVVGISWYEAVAFCMWLNDALPVSTSGKNFTVMLPTEQQWQLAALGDTGWSYPWGNDFDLERCSSKPIGELEEGTTPVHQYEGKGDSPYGVVDMVGNTWEWCLNDYKTGAQSIEIPAQLRVLRGGSAAHGTAQHLRANCRNCFDPNNRMTSVGFRVVGLFG